MTVLTSSLSDFTQSLKHGKKQEVVQTSAPDQGVLVLLFCLELQKGGLVYHVLDPDLS